MPVVPDAREQRVSGARKSIERAIVIIIVVIVVIVVVVVGVRQRGCERECTICCWGR
jgi:t-SNARE complex subunit (syntaxin)